MTDFLFVTDKYNGAKIAINTKYIISIYDNCIVLDGDVAYYCEESFETIIERLNQRSDA